MSKTYIAMVAVSIADFVVIRRIKSKPLISETPKIKVYPRGMSIEEKLTIHDFTMGKEHSKPLNPEEFINICQEHLDDLIKIFTSKNEVIIETNDKKQKRLESYLDACKYLKDEFDEIEIEIFCRGDVINSEEAFALFKKEECYNLVSKKISVLMDNQ